MKPIIISNGLASNKEIKEAVNTIRKWHNKIIFLYCVSPYPAKLEEVNFNLMKKLKKITKVKNIDDINLLLKKNQKKLIKNHCFLEDRYMPQKILQKERF